MAEITSGDLVPQDTNFVVEGGPASGSDGGVRKDTPYQFSDVFQSDEDRAKFSEYICSELMDVMNERKTLEDRWRKWRLQRRAKPEKAVRNSPWINASNVEPPLTAQKVLTIYSKLVGAFAVKKPPVEVKPMNLEDSDMAESIEKFFKIEAESRYGLDMQRKFNRIAYDLVSLGTQVVKVPFTVDQWSFKRQVAGGPVEQVTYLRHKGPEIVPVRLEDFFTRSYWKDVQRAPWVGVRYRFFKHELEQYEAQQMFQNIDQIINQPIESYDTNKIEALRTAGVDVGSLKNEEYDLFECNVFWDVDGDGIPEDIVVWVEPKSGVILRSQFNPLSVRDYEVLTYIDDPDSLYGVGLCEMLEDLQEENTALHRMRLDGTQLSMLKIFLTRRGSGIDDKVPLEPFMVLPVDDPVNDFRAIDFPDITQGCIISEQMVKEAADRISGANDYMAGFNDTTVKSGATATGTTFLAGQGNALLNNLLANVEQAMTNVYVLVLYQAIANADLMDLSFLPAGDLAEMKQVLQLKIEDLPVKFKFFVRTTDINKTDESRKQGFLMVSQLYNQYVQQMLGLLQAKANPQTAQNAEIQELLNSAQVGQTMMMEKILEFFEVGNPDDFLPFVGQTKTMMSAADKLRNQQVLAMKEQLNGVGRTEQTQGGAGGQIPNAAGGIGVGQPGAAGVPPVAAPNAGGQAGAMPPAGGIGPGAGQGGSLAGGM